MPGASSFESLLFGHGLYLQDKQIQNATTSDHWFKSSRIHVLVAFRFLSSEIAESYGFGLRCFKSMYQSIDLQPETMLKSVITDKDDALSAAILAHLPFVYHFFCIWHINMNVMKKCKPIFRQQLDNELGDKEIGDNQYKAGVDECWKAFL